MKLFTRGIVNYVVFFHPDGGGWRVHQVRLVSGKLIAPDGTEYASGMFVMVPLHQHLRVYFASIERSVLDEHAVWDRARRSLDWSTLTKPQSHWSNMYDQVSGVIQWVLLLYVAWQAGSAANQAAQVVGYLEFLQRSLSGGG